MKIPITLENENQLTATLAKFNGGSSSHTYTTGKQLLSIAALAEDALEQLDLPESHRAGATAIFSSGSKLPLAYKFQRVNRVTLARTGSGWTATEIKLVQVWRGGSQNITILPVQQEIIFARLRSQYTLATAE